MRTLLVLILTGFICYLFVKFIASKHSTRKTSFSNKGDQKTLAFVACKQCGLHLPQHEAIKAENGYFCDKEHEKIYARTRIE